MRLILMFTSNPSNKVKYQISHSFMPFVVVLALAWSFIFFLPDRFALQHVATAGVIQARLELVCKLITRQAPERLFVS